MAVPSSLQTLIIGASRGIGLALARQYSASGARVTATARSDGGLDELRSAGITALQLDVTSAESASRLASQLNGSRFNVVVYAAGVYGPKTSGLQAPCAADFDAVMHANVLGAMQVLPQLDGLLAPGAKLAVLSSLMGSIGARSNAGGWLYRASKAALNSVLKDVSLVFKDQAICVSLHPGWVRTDMGGAGADLSAEESATDLRHVLGRLTATDHGQFFNHDGAPIPW